MDTPLQRFFTPGVGFILGLVVLVVLAGLFLSRSELTGRRVLAVVMAFFGVIIGVNVTLAQRAVGTFPGLEVTNGYVASQSFDRDRAAQKALGWTLTPDYDEATRELRLAFVDREGLPADLRDLKVLVGRTTEAKDDMTPEFSRRSGVHVADLVLAPGKWMMNVEARAADGTLFRQRIDLFVQG